MFWQGQLYIMHSIPALTTPMFIFLKAHFQLSAPLWSLRLLQYQLDFFFLIWKGESCIIYTQTKSLQKILQKFLNGRIVKKPCIAISQVEPLDSRLLVPNRIPLDEGSCYINLILIKQNTSQSLCKFSWSSFGFYFVLVFVVIATLVWIAINS